MSDYKEIKTIDLSDVCGKFRKNPKSEAPPSVCSCVEMCQECLDKGQIIFYNKKKNGCLIINEKDRHLIEATEDE